MKLNQKEIFALTYCDPVSLSASSLSEAEKFTRSLALGHYENFPVGSILIPRKYRQDFFNVYAFARLADDVADELSEYSSEEKNLALNRLEKFLSDSDTAICRNPVIIALHHTMRKRNIPNDPFQRLIEAFRRDAEFTQPKTIEDIEKYCFYSANPVGEIVLRLMGLFNEETKFFSDQICTGLQLANFWQDISIDRLKNRIYIPKDYLEKFSLTNENLTSSEYSDKLAGLNRYLCETTEDYFSRGEKLLSYLPSIRLKLEIALTIAGGRTILDKVFDLKEKIFFQRPALQSLDAGKIFLRAVNLMRKY